MSFTVIMGSLELGVIYGIMALGVFLSYRTLNTPDLTVDGSFMLGGAISAVLSAAGHPLLGIAAGIMLGMAAGCITALLSTKLKIAPILSSILVMLGLYSINLRVMGGKANLSLINVQTIYTFPAFAPLGDYAKLALSFVFLVVVLLLFYFFLVTKFGFALRATGDNEDMVRANGVNTDLTKLVGLAVSNGMVGLSGALIVQYQKFADINMSMGMVIIGLSCVIIGEVVFGTKPLLRRLAAVALGSVLYRFLIAFVLQMGMPATDLKLISAVIVAVALSASRWGKVFTRFKNKDRGNEDA